VDRILEQVGSLGRHLREQPIRTATVQAILQTVAANSAAVRQ
jgi:hypothetical protein